MSGRISKRVTVTFAAFFSSLNQGKRKPHWKQVSSNVAGKCYCVINSLSDSVMFLYANRFCYYAGDENKTVYYYMGSPGHWEGSE